jgi:hypothetical protein
MVEVNISKLLNKGGIEMLVDFLKDRKGMTAYLVKRGHNQKELDEEETSNLRYLFCNQLVKDTESEQAESKVSIG